MARLTLALLGPLQVTLDGHLVSSFGYDKVRALLAYLAVESARPHDRSALAALLWAAEPEAVARKNLRTALATLRAALDDTRSVTPFLAVTRDSVQFNPASDHELDVATFDALLAEVELHAHPDNAPCSACAARLTRAAGLYRGEFVHQIEVPNSVAWEEWVLLRREQLYGQMLAALTQLSAYHEGRGEDQLARQHAWRMLALEPWNEAAHRSLMRVFARSGQRKAALAQYERCRRVLADELGVEPAAETTALYEHIQAKPLEPTAGVPAQVTVSATAPPPGEAVFSLPVPPTPLIGREQDVARMEALLRDDTVRLLTLVGPPGIGKTRLALAAAARLHDAFAHGASLVELAPIRDPALVPATIAQQLGVRESSGQTLADVLKRFLQAKALLLVLDTFEHLLAAAPLVAELLAACPQLKCLVTSRAPLQLRAEHRFPVTPLALPDPLQPDDVGEIARSAAVTLFIARAQAITPGFAIHLGNAALVAAICTRLDGLPLAIELAAARCTILSLQALLDRLQTRLVLLRSGARDYPARQQTLRAAIGWSYWLLPAPAQVLFARLAVFRGDFTLPMLTEVCTGWNDSAGDALDGMTTLVNNSLVQQVPDAAEPRFRLLDTLREYAYERLQELGEVALLCRQHARAHLQLAEQAELALQGPMQRHWLEHLERAHADIRAALSWCLDDAQGRWRSSTRVLPYAARTRISVGWPPH